MSKKNALYFRILLVLSLLCSGGANDCETKETCDQCIQDLNCVWCISPKNGTSHCLIKTETASCLGDIENPANFSAVLEQKPLTESEQISPQKIQLKLRKNEKFDINFSYRQSANYPVDLYYIMDLSQSMNPSKVKLAELGESLAIEMKRKTNNFRIGFGSFVDKLALPYVNTNPQGLKSPCEGCAPPYSFKNHLSLMPNATQFSDEVKKTKISGNLDAPEGGLDAIMQAIVCKKEIGWRPNARRLLVLSTDAVSHIAGDGKLGGVIEPNDATCHMKDNSYTDGLIYDYPSVSQINYVARQNNINIIFAIVLTDNNDPNNLKGHYQAMSDAIENSKIGTLQGHSNNVVKFIADIYDQIRDSVRITSDANKDVRVNITANCTNSIDGGCTNVKPGQTIDFKATIEPLICHKDANTNKKTIKIKPEGLEDTLTIELEVLCSCSCDVQKNISDAECTDQGYLECGICRCNEGRFGAKCQCDRTESKGEDPSLCIKPGDKTEICSGQGKCICGICDCINRPEKNQFFYGKFCECSNSTCHLKCSGRGICDCGTCKDCEKGWTGRGCECSSDQTSCMKPGSKELCSGHGDCVCGKCVCTSEGNDRYSGKHCEFCASCPDQRCEQLKPCVECQVYQSGKFANPTVCRENCTEFKSKIVKKLEEKAGNDVQRCRLAVENDCSILFEYSYDDNNNLIVTAEEKRICPILPPLLAIILGVIGSVLLIGIITLVAWKVLTTIHDKKEYARFLNERNQTEWNAGGENPLYKPGTTHFQNPAYHRASQRFSVLAAAKKAQAQTNGSNDQ